MPDFGSPSCSGLPSSLAVEAGRGELMDEMNGGHFEQRFGSCKEFDELRVELL